MAKRQIPWLALGGAAVLGMTLTLGCGSDGGGGGGGTATVAGNVSGASTASVRPLKRSWLARVGEEVLGLARRAYAAADNSLDGFTISVARGSRGASAISDGLGRFAVFNAPSGDVTVTFARDNCAASVGLADVVDGSVLGLDDVIVNCNQSSVGRIDETFQAVLENKPASANGNLNVCAFGGGGNHIRAVKTKNGAGFLDAGGAPASFADLHEGDLLEITGQRAGLGTNSAVDASLVRIVSSGHTGNCQGLPTPTPEPTSTPTATATP